MEEICALPKTDRSISESAAHRPCMREILTLWLYRLCNLAMELERMQPFLDAFQALKELISLLPPL